jgi:hypothetical protein
MTEPKLLTEAEWRANLRVWVNIAATDAIILLMRYHDLIAPEPEPEPVDPLLEEAREIAASCYDITNHHLAANMRRGICDDQPSVVSALTALRRNLELAERPTLTHLQAALLLCNAMADAEVEDVSCYDLGPLGQTTKGRKIADALVERLK